MRRIAVLLAGMLFTTLTIGPVWGHADLTSMTPAPGSVLTEPVPSVTLTFGEEVRALGSVAVVIDPAGHEVQTGLVVQGSTVTLSLGELTVVGEYHVHFRVDSADGHVIEGSEVFTYNGPVASPSPIAVATLAGGGNNGAGAESGEGGDGFEGGSMLGLGLLAIIVIGGIVYAMSQRKKG
mgnify:FL=1